jgi:predicted nucleic acid-binding protein
MRRIRAYVDTSVFGGTQDEEYAEASRRFFDRVDKGEFAVLVSAETLRELVSAPIAVQKVWQNLPAEAVEEVAVDEEVVELADGYIDANVLGHTSASDALHVAAATVAGADLILSWNFKHIVNFSRIRGFNSVNVNLGYRSMTILSPLEVACGNEEEDV